MSKSLYALIFSGLAVILSGFSIIMAGCSAFNLPFECNNASFVLGTLTLLATLLIGWQIYSKIDIEIRIKDFEKYLSQLKKNTELDTKTTLFVSLAQLGRSAYNKVDLKDDSKLLMKADAIQSLFNALCLWQNDMDSPLSKEAYNYCISKLKELINGTEFEVEFADEKNAFIEAAMRTEIRELIDFAINIKVK